MQFQNLHIIGKGSTEEPNTVHNVGDAPELEDPKTKVIFHILDCHILVGKWREGKTIKSLLTYIQ